MKIHTMNFGNAHEAAHSINRLGLADNLITLVGYSGGHSVGVFKITDDQFKELTKERAVDAPNFDWPHE